MKRLCGMAAAALLLLSFGSAEAQEIVRFPSLDDNGPGHCNDRRHSAAWTSAVPLLVLMGAADVWTPAAPCKGFLDGAIARGSQIEMQIYPGAYHGFDAPNNPRRELPDYRTRAGVVPIIGTDPAARADALVRVPAFLGRFLKN